MSPPPISVCTKYSNYTSKILFVCSCHLPKILGKKANATTKVTLRATNDCFPNEGFNRILFMGDHMYMFNRMTTTMMIVTAE